MKDRVFTGTDVPAALAEAAQALGVPEAELRYVVLDPGTDGGRGLQPTPAQVAVLLAGSPAPPAAEEAAQETWARPEDPRAGIRETVRAVAEAAGIDVSAEIVEGDEKVIVQIGGPDHDFFFGDDDAGDVLRATEHIIQRTYGSDFLPRPLRVDCAGFQEKRDEALADKAQELAEEVRADGQPRTTEPLNAYERRIVHMALNAAADVKTYSVGEGSSRRVTVARAEGGDEAASDPPPGE